MSSFLHGLGHMLDHAVKYLPETKDAIGCVKDAIDRAVEKHKALE